MTPREGRIMKQERLSRRDMFKAAAGIAATPFVLREVNAQRPPVVEDAGTLQPQ